MASCRCSRLQERCGVHQVVGDDAESDPASDAVGTAISAASQTVAPLEHTDAAFAADSPALTTTKPALAFVHAPRRCFPPLAWQNHASDAARQCRIFVPDRREAPIGRRDVRGAAKDRDVAIKCRRPQRRVRGSALVAPTIGRGSGWNTRSGAISWRRRGTALTDCWPPGAIAQPC